METIGTFYSDFVKNSFITRNIKKGKVPLKAEIAEHLSIEAKKTASFNLPASIADSHLLKEEEESSSLKTNALYSDIYQDLSVSYSVLKKQSELISSCLDSSSDNYKRFNKRLEQVERDLSDILFQSKELKKSEDFFAERFKTNEMIDLSLSTVNIDNANGLISMMAKTNDIKEFMPSPGALSLSYGDQPGVSISADLSGMELKNLFSQSGMPWQHRIVTLVDLQEFWLDVIIKVPPSMRNISTIKLECTAGGRGTVQNVELFYSEDNLNWFKPSGSDMNQRLSSNNIFIFSEISPLYWKIRLTKKGYDSHRGEEYEFLFGLKKILFITKDFKTDKIDYKQFLYSKPIKRKNGDPIDKVGLFFCESIPEKTEMNYSLVGLNKIDLENLERGIASLDSFVYIPIKKEDKIVPVIDFSKRAEQTSLIDPISLSTLTSVDQIGNYLDFNQDKSYIKSSQRVLRNAGNNEVGQNGNALKIRGLDNGWSFNGTRYETIVYVGATDGEVLDFGNTFIFIDGEEKTGQIVLSAGFHRISVYKENWISLDLSRGFILDPLYPYNHKYLVEGIADRFYGIELTEEQKKLIDPLSLYKKRFKYWEKELIEEKYEVFLQNKKTTLDIFSYNRDNNSQEKIIVYPSENGEVFSIVVESRSDLPIESVVLKVEQKSLDERSTPVLREYILKFQ